LLCWHSLSFSLICSQEWNFWIMEFNSIFNHLRNYLVNSQSLCCVTFPSTRYDGSNSTTSSPTLLLFLLSFF
jgi:hypothetical protein